MNKKILTYFVFYYLIISLVAAQNDDPPESPDLKRVTVDLATGNTWIFWSLSPSPGVIAYNVYRLYDWGADLITIVNDSTATSYENIFSNADRFSESYQIAANRDTTTIIPKTISPLTEEHATIFTTLQFDSCLAELKLSWTPYIGWGDSLKNYKIFKNTNSGSFTVIDSLPPESISFTDTTIEAYVSYCYYVQANHKNGLISTSNMVCKYTEMPRIPGFINADYSTINPENDEVFLSFTIDPASEIYHYKLLRANEPNGVYDTIADFTDHRSEKLTYTDTPEDLSSPFYYRLAAINPCNKIILRSNIASTMVLTIHNEDAVNYLEWTLYLGWKGGVEKYEVYRKTIENSYELIATVNTGDTSYADNVELNNLIYLVDDATFCYYIKAIEGQDNPHGIRGTGTTCTKCVILQPKIFIPNAIVPNSLYEKNRRFKPFFSFTPKAYHLVIKNRLGNIIFESKNPYESWDGSYPGGAIVREGTYIYFLSVTTGAGKTIVRKGLINVIFH